MAIFQKPPKSIIVQTRKGSDIKNEQVETAFSFGGLMELEDLKSEFPNGEMPMRSYTYFPIVRTIFRK